MKSMSTSTGDLVESEKFRISKNLNLSDSCKASPDPIRFTPKLKKHEKSSQMNGIHWIINEKPVYFQAEYWNKLKQSDFWNSS